MFHQKIIFLIILAIFSCDTFALDAQSLARQKSEQDIPSAISALHQKYKTEQGGKNASYIPELAKVNPDYFAIAIATVNGEIYSVGDSKIPFAIESISKPFAYLLALNDQGDKIVTDKVGLNATGHAFNSIIAIEEKDNHLQNPLVNAGAIQITSLIKGQNTEEKWQRMLSFIKTLSDGKPSLGQTVYQSEMKTNQRNRAIAELLNSYQMIAGDPMDALMRYTKACSIMITTEELALMGATLANKGIHPITHQSLIDPRYVQDALSEMVVNGLYENSGKWFVLVGLPSKSGVGGGILAIVPNKMAIAVFSPPLDEAGNSVRAQKVIAELVKNWNLHLLSK